MNDDRLIAVVRRALESVAPELAGVAIEPSQTFRDQFEIDSMDFLNFIIVLHQQTGLDIPESDYPRLTTLEGCLDYLRPRLAPSGAT